MMGSVPPLQAMPALAERASLTSRGWSATIRDGTVISLTNRLTGERPVRPSSQRLPLAGLYLMKGQAMAISSADRVGSQRKAGFWEQSASWVDKGGKRQAWQRSRFEIDPRSGDLIVTQEGQASSGGVYGISWGIGEIPDRYTVLVPGNSGQRFGPDAPAGTRIFDYPVGWEAPFVLIQGEKGGFIIRAEDPGYGFKNLTVDHTGGTFQLRFESRGLAPFESKARLKSMRWRLSAYRGSWQAGAAIYHRWAKAHYHLVPLARQRPAWVKDIRFVVIMGMDIPVLEILAKKVAPAQTLLYIPGWRRDEYDRNYPDYTASPQFGPFVKAAHRLGFRVMPHVNYFGCDPRNPLYSTFRKWHMRDPFSKELQWWEWTRASPPIKFAYINPASRAWRKLFVSKMVEVYRRYRVDALHLDQTLVMINDDNGLIDGLSCIQGNRALHCELRQALPQVALSGEGLDEVTCQYEAFAQRHVWGLNHVDQTWNERILAMSHPISSSLMLPYTTIYGYLGMANPQTAPEVYLAWRRAYEHFGVIPTYAWPDLEQLKSLPPAVAFLLEEACFFQRYRPVPDFGSPWGCNDLFRYRLSDGRRAVYRGRQGVLFGVISAQGKIEVLSRRLEGVTEASLPGSVPGWPAYDGKRIFGLDPDRAYLWSKKPRNLKALHIASLPEGVILTQAGIHPELARFRFEDSRGTVRLWEFSGRAVGGVKLSDGQVRRFPGIAFNDPLSGGDIHPEGDGLFAHPPWKSSGMVQEKLWQGRGLGFTFIEFSIRLPSQKEIVFESGVCLMPGAPGKSDGITFRVQAISQGKTLKAEVHHDGADPVPLRLDLSAFRGQNLVLRLESDPGPAGSPAFDWGRFARPRIIAHESRPASLRLAGDRPIHRAVAAEGEVTIRPLAGGEYQLDLMMPNVLLLPFGSPTGVTPPFDLLQAPFVSFLLPSNGLEISPVTFMRGAIGEAICGGEMRRALHEHPPSNGKTLVDYWLKLPTEPVRFVSATGIRDGSVSQGVTFEVEINGKPMLRKTLKPGSGWVPAEVDLSPWRGQSVILTLITDSMGDYSFDWAVWGEPRIH